MIAPLNTSTAAAAMQPDQVTLAIEAHRTAWAALARDLAEEDAASGEDGMSPAPAAAWDAASCTEEEAWTALLATRPANADGLARLIRYIADAPRIQVLDDARDLGRNLAEAAEAVRRPIASAEPDPVFALIEEHQAAYAAWAPLAAVWNEAVMGSPEFAKAEAAAEEPGRREQAAMLALMAARPTTAAGLWALTAYLPEAVRQVSPDPGTEAQAALDTLRESALQLELAQAAAEAREDRPEEWTILDTCLVSLVRELVAIEAEQTAILKAGNYADAYDVPDWVRLEGHRESILGRVIAIRAHTMEGLKAKASLFGLESVKGLEQPSRDLSRSIVTDLAGIDAAPSAEAHPDAPLLALGLPFLAAWRDEGAADPVSTGERREVSAGVPTFDEAHARCSALAGRIAALPATTVEGLGVKALALACYTSDLGSPAGPMPEPHASSGASDDVLLWQIQAGAAQILAGDAGTSVETPANAAAAPADQPSDPTATALDLSGCSVPQLARLYEMFQATYDHLSALGQLPCFQVGDIASNPAGEIIDREADRLAAMFDTCIREIERRSPASRSERDDALSTRVTHELRCNGRIHDPALMRDLVQAWGENGHTVTEAGR